VSLSVDGGFQAGVAARSPNVTYFRFPGGTRTALARKKINLYNEVTD
jgi:hypothetical protein